MGILETARHFEGNLSETGRKALNLLLSDPQEMAKLPAAKVAALLGVHETTMTRLATQLGYTGYSQLRESLAREGQAPVSSAERMNTRKDSAYTLAALVDDEGAAMQRLARTLPQEDIDNLAQRMLKARRVFLFGPPYAQTVLALLDRRLRRLGIDAVPLPLSGRLIAEHLVNLGKDDLLLSFVFRRPEPRLGRIMGHAHTLGAGTAVIADEEGLSFDPRPDQILVARRGPSADQRSLIVPTLVVYALQAAIVHAAGSRTVQALRLLDDLARVVGDDEPSHFA